MPRGPQLRVVSYNVHGLRGPRPALLALLRRLAPDVLVLQETPRWRWRHHGAALAHSLGLVVAAGGLPAVGNLILADLRVTVKESWAVRFPLTPGRHLRGAAFARCLVAGSPVLVVGSHLSTDPAERPRQARALAAELAANESDPAVLAVDVNDEPGSPTWQTLTGSLVDCASAAGPPGAPGVVGGSGPAPTFPADGPRRRIDAIFADPRLTVLDHRVVNLPEARRASDHLPVLAELRLS